MKRKGATAQAEPVLLGITKASLTTQDDLVDLKENINSSSI